MNEEFLEKYTAALNKATELTEQMQKKGILHEGVDDQLISDFRQANAEVERLSNQLLNINK